MKPAVSEAAIAAVVVAYLESLGHDVYQEVPVRGGIADIVSLVGKGREVWVIETKDGWSLDLLRQCMERRASAHRVFAACPPSRGQRDNVRIAEELGIGALSVHVDDDDRAAWSQRVTVSAMARRQSSDPRYGAKLRNRCCEGHKTHAKAGTAGGGRYTPFRATCDALLRAVVDRPGIALKDAIERISHHYGSHATARSTLPKWIEAGKVPGVRIERVGRKIHLHPAAS